ncbi:MAG: hypothetical protein GC192_16615 [Bacteroidetes bacterium]|nr:hypothetical protein [Bacteroidota bacterium]
MMNNHYLAFPCRTSHLVSLILGLVFWSQQAIGQNNLIVTGAQTIAGSATYDNVTVQSGGVLTVDGVLTVNQDMTIEGGGNVTHSPRFEAGLQLNVSGNLTIQSTGAINVDEKGLKGGLNGSAFNQSGEAYNDNGQIISGSQKGDNVNNPGWGAAGGSYGGRGAFGRIGSNLPDIASNAEYGTIENPNRLGAGGGATLCGGCDKPGGNGGGLIKITATNVIIEGTISSNGASSNGGSGSGGGIKIASNTISGSGTIQAKGGNNSLVSFYPTGAGGGGRIAIFYSSMSFPINNISASGGNNNNYSHLRANAGTILLQDSNQPYGRTIMDNKGIVSQFETALKTNLEFLEELSLVGDIKVNYINSGIPGLTITEPIVLQNKSKLRIGAGTAFSISNPSGFDFVLSGGAILDLDSSSIVSANAMSIDNANANLGTNFTFPQPNDFYLAGNGTVKVFGNSIFSIPSFNPSNFNSGTFHLTDGSTLELASTSIVVGNGLTWVKDGKVNSNDEITDLTIQSGGIVTHSVRYLPGLSLNVTGILDIQSGGQINTNAKGLKGGGGNGSIFGLFGEAFDENGTIIAGSGKTNPAYYDQNPGGSYGGIGGRQPNRPGGEPNKCYGTIEDPVYLGAGGAGNSADATTFGGNGGGRITIIANSLVINGAITANGEDGRWCACNCCPNYGGGAGGSGGSVKVIANTISGTGNIESKGGKVIHFYDPSGGGGGRIALFYDNFSLPTSNIIASGGKCFTASNLLERAEQNGSAGTIYLKDNTNPKPQIIIDNQNINSTNFTPFLSNSNTTPDLFLKEKGNFIIEDGKILKLDSLNASVFQTGTSLWIAEGGRIDLTSADIVIGNGTLIKDGKLGTQDNPQNVTVEAGGVITHSLRNLKGLTLKTAQKIEIKSGGAIDVSDKGLLGGIGNSGQKSGETFSPNGNIFRFGGATSFAACGGSFGGLGGPGGSGGPLQPIYGDKYFPDFLGSGGGGTGSIGYNGGNGGGRILLNTPELLVNGSIKANGGSTTNPGTGGGSGGSILAYSGEISGSGNIQANGGAGVSNFTSDGGNGGGGRVAIYTHTPTFPIANIKADITPGGLVPAQKGTVVYSSCSFENNAGVDSILFPQAAVYPRDTTFSPQVIVRNYSPTPLVFPVRFQIGNIYTDESYVSLASGQKDTVQFTPYTVAIGGAVSATGSIIKPEDDCDSNDVKTVNLGFVQADEPVVISVSPASGGNSGVTTVTIHGQNFQEGVRAWIEKNGIVNFAQAIEYRNSTTFFASFHLSGLDTGMYDVKVINPDLMQGALPTAFRVNPGPIGWGGTTSSDCLSASFDPGQLLDVELLQPSAMRYQSIYALYIEYQNNSNIDIPLPTGTLKSMLGAAVSFTVDGLMEDKTELPLELKEQPDGPSTILRAGAGGRITFYTRAKLGEGAQYQVFY